MNAVVTVKSIKVFGDSKEYPADEVTMKKFVKWAMETKADLRAHPMLNEQLRFGEGATGGITGRFYQEEDVTRYMGKLLQLQRERGDPMRTGLTNKVKLDVVKRALPTVGLKSLFGVDAADGNRTGGRLLGRGSSAAREGTEEV